jgi:nitroimidazol reductase NimA-like FMN-containing flavoprotein (pyridoxamine 5'-phosphate oxidase superfamily)
MDSQTREIVERAHVRKLFRVISKEHRLGNRMTGAKVDPLATITEPMTSREIEQFLTCARAGRIGISLDEGPYVVPVGYAYLDGKIIIHTCRNGLKMQAMRKNRNVCFEVDETVSDASMFKSVIAFGDVKIVDGATEKIPYLQKLIDKYRVPVEFEDYIKRPGRDREKELKNVKIIVITLRKVTGRKLVRKNGNF